MLLFCGLRARCLCVQECLSGSSKPLLEYQATMTDAKPNTLVPSHCPPGNSLSFLYFLHLLKCVHNFNPNANKEILLVVYVLYIYISVS